MRSRVQSSAMTDLPASGSNDADGTSSRRGATRPAPNYAARRMLVTTVAIMAVVAFGVVAWTAVSDDDSPTRGSAGSWSEIAIVDRRTGDVTILDEDGQPDRTLVGRGRVTDVYTVADRLALVGPGQIVIEGGDAEVTVPLETGVEVTPVRTDGGLDLVVGSPTGGNVLIVDVLSGEVLDVGELARTAEPQIFAAPRMFAETLRWSDDGTVFAVADASSFQTIVVRKGSPDVSFFRSQPVAVSDDRVATSQIVGGQADLELYDFDRESKARVPVPIPAGGVMVDGELVLVTTDGGLYRVRDGDTEAERVARLAVPAGDTVATVRPVGDGERLLVTGGTFEAVVDLDGSTLFTTTFTTAIEPFDGSPSWSCVPIGGGDTFHSIVAVDTGEQLADLSGTVVTDTSGDGCTVLTERAGVFEVVGPEGTVVVGEGRAAALGPDGVTVVRTASGGATDLLRIDDEQTLADPVDLSAHVPTNGLVAFLD